GWGRMQIAGESGSFSIGQGMARHIEVELTGKLYTALSDCREGDHIKILKIHAGGLLAMRLSEMGLVRGQAIEIVKYAPLKDPLEIKINSTLLSLRISEACQIEVEKVNEKNA
ncbi:MAG TPA: hypothetical protein DC049_00045, partial [Spirochaetia bacterium]|nr:hypothetical protein [Spirochaetia bacterium]